MLDDSCITDYYSRKGMEEDGKLKKTVTAADIGTAVRKKRKEDGLTLADAAALCGVGYRFMSDLENGKATVQVGKVLQVLTALGLDVTIEARKWPNE
jgi:HTH-type transcriptional regulator / antitoxin HipB